MFEKKKDKFEKIFRVGKYLCFSIFYIETGRYIVIFYNSGTYQDFDQKSKKFIYKLDMIAIWFCD